MNSHGKIHWNWFPMENGSFKSLNMKGLWVRGEKNISLPTHMTALLIGLSYDFQCCFSKDKVGNNWLKLFSLLLLWCLFRTDGESQTDYQFFTLFPSNYCYFLHYVEFPGDSVGSKNTWHREINDWIYSVFQGNKHLKLLGRCKQLCQSTWSCPPRCQ